MLRDIFSVGLMLLAVPALCGCDWLAGEAAEKAFEFSASADGEDVDVEIDPESGSVSIKSDKGDISLNVEDDSGEFELNSQEGTVRIATGKNAAIPDDFPKDVPLFPGFQPDMVQSLPGGTTSLAGAVPASIPAVKSYYDQAALREGWTETESIAQEHVASLNYTKGERTLQVTAIPDMSGTMVSITTGNKAQ